MVGLQWAEAGKAVWLLTWFRVNALLCNLAHPCGSRVMARRLSGLLVSAPSDTRCRATSLELCLSLLSLASSDVQVGMRDLKKIHEGTAANYAETHGASSPPQL